MPPGGTLVSRTFNPMVPAGNGGGVGEGVGAGVGVGAGAAETEPPPQPQEPAIATASKATPSLPPWVDFLLLTFDIFFLLPGLAWGLFGRSRPG